MARTISQIQQQIINEKNGDSVLSAYSWSDSKVAIWRLWTYVVAVCIWTLENLFDYHRNEVEAILAAQKPHTLQWYVQMARQYQHGVALPEGSDSYPAPSSDPAVAIVRYAAAVELSNLVRLKVAKESAGVLEPLLPAELDAFAAYIGRVKDAGVRLQVTSGAPDVMQLAVTIYYDPLVLDSTGARLDGTDDTPVLSATNAFLENLPFNGVFVLNKLRTALHGVEGVVIGHIVSAQANYAMTPLVPVTVQYVPDAGYMVLDEAFFIANVVFLPYGAS